MTCIGMHLSTDIWLYQRGDCMKDGIIKALIILLLAPIAIPLLTLYFLCRMAD